MFILAPWGAGTFASARGRQLLLAAPPIKFVAFDAHARRIGPCDGGANMTHLLRKLLDDEGQDIAEYAVMLAVILVLVVGTIRLVGSNANNAFSSVASSIQ